MSSTTKVRRAVSVATIDALHRFMNVWILRTICIGQSPMKWGLDMPRLLHYVAGVRLIVDPYDHHLWNFTIRSRRYHLRARGGTFVLRTDDGTLLGTYNDWNLAIAAAKEYAHKAITEPIPIVARV